MSKKDLWRKIIRVWEIYFIPEFDVLIKNELARDKNGAFIKFLKSQIIYKQSVEKINNFQEK